MPEKLLEIKNIAKYFPGVEALKNISFDIYRNTVHCIVGENGAGKSTFIKILTGALKRSEGKILFRGNEYEPVNTREAMDAGMSALFQELNVVDQLTVEQNLTLGMEESKFGFIKKSKKVSDAFDVLKSLDPSISPDQTVSSLSVAQKQILEITRAITSRARVIIMDEPTAALSEEETESLFRIIKKIKQQDVTVIYISHRLSEIFQIGDYVTVLRDGMMVGTRSISDFSYCEDEVESCTELIRLMIGKIVAEHYIPSKIDYDTEVLITENVSTEKLKNINFVLYKGEILGFYGLVGSGKTEIARAIYGLDTITGKITVNGKTESIRGPKKAIERGISMVPEERRAEGLVTGLKLRENIPIMKMSSVSQYGIINKHREKQIARKYIEKLRIAARNEDQKVALLSGGNQQKVVVSKCLNAESKIFLLDEPTRGVDVGAKEEIHNIVRSLSATGASIIVFSSELPEIINLCDRIILLYGGEIKAIIENGSDIDTEKIMHIATGGA